MNNYPHAIRNAARLGLCHSILLPFPYAVDCDTTAPEIRTEKHEGTLRVFHPSRLDWGQADSGEARNGTKGNDRFLRAFVKACHNGLDAHCLILDRGPDRDNARRLIDELDGDKFFTWKPNLTQRGYHNELAHCDLVIDQFDIQSFGGVTIEAMAHGRPVMGYVDEYCHSLTFDKEIPVISARSEREIEAGLWLCEDKAYLSGKSLECWEWVRQYENPEVLGRRYLVFAQIAVGDFGIA